MALDFLSLPPALTPQNPVEGAIHFRVHLAPEVFAERHIDARTLTQMVRGRRSGASSGRQLTLYTYAF
jgi:hypothetical protein